MRDDDLRSLVGEVILPVLEPYGFQHVARPDGWMTPEIMLESNDRWFSATFDQRDLYFAADLGRLFLFHDVMPRVIVRGPLSISVTNTKKENSIFLREELERISRRLPEVLDRFEELCSQALTTIAPTGSPTKAAKKASREFFRFLGPQITLEGWRQRIEKR